MKKVKYGHRIEEQTVELRAEVIDALGRRVVSLRYLSKRDLSYAVNPSAMVRRVYRLVRSQLLQHVIHRCA